MESAGGTGAPMVRGVRRPDEEIVGTATPSFARLDPLRERVPGTRRARRRRLYNRIDAPLRRGSDSFLRRACCRSDNMEPKRLK